MWKRYLEALHEYLYKAKVIIYACLLAVALAVSFVRKQFPELHPPWQLLRWVVTILLFGVLFVPPAVTVVRGKRK